MRMIVDMRFVVVCLVVLVHVCEALAVGNTSVKCRDNDRLSLLSLKRGLVDPEGTLYSWGGADNQTDCCRWDHVSCDSQTGHVVRLDVSFCSLEGTISPSLAQLHHLNHLDLRFSNFTPNQFPTFILSLKRLQYLNLFFTNLTGNISLNLGYSLPHLQHLDLSQTNLKGNITLQLGYSLSNLQHLDVSQTNLNVNIPLQLGYSLSNLQYLDLSFTNLKGKIPLQLGYMSHLQTLSLAGSHLEGRFPKFLALCSLTELDLSKNSLTGQLDDFVASFRHCANISLQFLDLSHNEFTGSVPNFSQFSYLKGLYLDNNKLNGTVNDGIGLLSKLEHLFLHHNFLRGIISETHFLRLSRLKYLFLSFNDLAFQISSDWIPPFQLEFIHLASCKLGPGFPSWLQTQKSCSDLDISYADVRGTIPSWFWNFTFDYLNLSHNHITGEMQSFPVQEWPSSILDFSSNLFEGSIPSTLSRVEILLELSNNKFTDASSLLCPKSNVILKFLDISNNQLSGMLPDCWKYFESLMFLDVSNNIFFGKIPTSMGSLIKIKSLHLGFNKFSGEIPLSLNKCTELVAFDVVGNELSGLIPSWIGEGLKKLSVLILRFNKFFGSLPSNICNLPQLQILDLSMNNISGSLPKCLNHLSAFSNETGFDPTISYPSNTPVRPDRSSSLDDIAMLVWKGKVSKYQSILRFVKSIDLSCNMLMGEIPSELMDLVGLISLNISRNMLSGQIPTTIGQLKSLDALDMSRNHLFGHIPSGLSQIDRLSVMDLSYNNLSGEIPHGTQLQSFDPSVYAGNAHLCGAPLPKCPTRPTQDHPNDENSEEDDQFISRGFFISLSLGFGTGFWGICSLIFLSKSFRYAYFRFVSDVYDKVYVVVVINAAKLRRWRRSVST